MGIKLNRAEIVSNEIVGHDHFNNPVHHIRTLGGAHLMVSIDPYGEAKILSTAAHRAFAKNAAEGNANIKWDESSNLFKSEAMNVPAVPVESNPTNHFKQAAYFSKRFGKVRKTKNPTFEDKLLMVMLQESALTHYKMMGDDEERAKRNHDIQSHYHSEVGEDYNPPFDNEALVNAFDAKKTQAEVEKAETLEKDRGRITFPANPKITNRPDQNIKHLNPEDNTNLKVNAKRIANVTDHKSQALEIALKMPTVQGVTAASKKNGLDSKGFSKYGDAGTAEHEGAHYLFNEIEKKHGKDIKNKFIDHLVNSIDADSFGAIHNYLQSGFSGDSYKKLFADKTPESQYKYKEEILTNLRDSLAPKKEAKYNKRAEILNKYPESEKNKLDQKMKQSWSNVLSSINSFNMPILKNESTISVDSALVDFILPDLELEINWG